MAVIASTSVCSPPGRGEAGTDRSRTSFDISITLFCCSFQCTSLITNNKNVEGRTVRVILPLTLSSIILRHSGRSSELV
jgi:hypothetical protein